MHTYRLPVQIERLEEGIYLASCPAIQGCHAEGHTIGEALDNLRSVTLVIYKLCQEKKLPFVTDAPDVPLASVIWEIEVPLALEAA
ncbi:MAG: type II toxin-antitoxin system HicB family antitoxin [Anaerolineae bacterium]|nr:type II toxin-antitoxin system HicB family antitoxin [Anaerolineae bacterium]MCD6553759.1 type II toxin-antitoxin system HicB family antitoxin [Anaerolineae bacterium]